MAKPREPRNIRPAKKSASLNASLKDEVESKAKSVPDEVCREAERIGQIVRQKLMEIMDLQGEIDALLRESHSKASGSRNWQYASLEALQRLVLLKAIQFVLFEPVARAQGNDEFKVAADRMIEVVVAQLKTLKTKRSDWVT